MSLPRAKPVTVDLVTITSIILACMLFMYSATGMESATFQLSIFNMMLLVAGLGLAFFLGMIAPGGLSDARKKNVVIWLTVSLGVVFLLNLVTKWQVVETSLSIGAVTAGVLAGVSEDVFFRGFLTNWFMRTMGPFIGIMAGAGVFTIYHLSRYGSSPSNLMLVFGGGVVLGVAMWQTRSLTAPVLAHMLVNFLAFGGFLAGGLLASVTVIAVTSVLVILLFTRNPRGVG